MGAMTPPMDHSSPLDSGIRKRVCKACDRCRLKKSKCDGASPCSRCKADNAICVFGERKKSHDKVYPKGYVEMLESQQAQLVAGLQQLYQRAQTGQGWLGSPLTEHTNGQPLTHDILERLGALKQDGHASSDRFEEDLGLLQQRLIADGAGFMHHDVSHDSHSEASAPSPVHEPLPQKPAFSNPFALNQFPPTPPKNSPFPQPVRSVPNIRPTSMPQPQIQPRSQSHLSWSTPMAGFNDAMDFVCAFDGTMMDSPLDLTAFAPPIFPDPSQGVPTAINPVLTMKDWAGQDDLQRYFGTTMV